MLGEITWSQKSAHSCVFKNYPNIYNIKQNSQKRPGFKILLLTLPLFPQKTTPKISAVCKPSCFLAFLCKLFSLDFIVCMYMSLKMHSSLN